MHVVVTGSTGFVGSTLVPKLLKLGHDVTALSRRSINSSFADHAGNFSELIVSDLCEITSQTFPTCDAVIHLAGIAHRKGMKDETVYEKVNYAATVHLASLAADNGCKHFIFMSTAKVHAEATSEPINSSSPYAPPDQYSETKARAEQTLFGMDLPMPVTALRPPAVLGMPAKANLKHLIRLARSSIIPVPNPPNSRCFIGLENLCSATIKCMEHENPCGGGYLVHDGSPISTAELVKTIANANKRQPRLIQLPKTVFKISNRTIYKTTGKSLLNPFYEDFVIDCDQFIKQYGWSRMYNTVEQIHAMFSNQQG